MWLIVTRRALNILSTACVILSATILSFAASPNQMAGSGNVRINKNNSTLQQILRHSKPKEISFVDQLLLRPATIIIGASGIDLLVNRLTNKVEYIWSPVYGRYIRPKFVMPGVQDLYNKSCS